MNADQSRPGSVVDTQELQQQLSSVAAAQGAKIRDLRKARGYTIEELAGRSGLHPNTVGRIERGTSDAALEQWLAIAAALSVQPEALSPFSFEVPPAAPKKDLDDDAFALIDLLDVRVSAGNGAFNGHHEAMGRFAFSRDWLKRRGVRPETARIVRARGDSMADKIYDGDILLVDTTTRTLDQDGVYVIELDGADFVKVLQRDFATGGLQIISYNPAYKPIALTAEQASDLRISGRVVWRGGEM